MSREKFALGCLFASTQATLLDDSLNFDNLILSQHSFLDFFLPTEGSENIGVYKGLKSALNAFFGLVRR